MIAQARIAGTEIPSEKRIEYSLQYVYGIGHTSAKKILEATVRGWTQRGVRDVLALPCRIIRDEASASYFRPGRFSIQSSPARVNPRRALRTSGRFG